MDQVRLFKKLILPFELVKSIEIEAIYSFIHTIKLVKLSRVLFSY